MSQYAAFRFGRDAPSRIATSVVMFDEVSELLPEERMYQAVIPFYPAISSGSGGGTTTSRDWASYPQRVDLTFYQGDDVTVLLFIEDPSDPTADLSTTWEWTAQIRVLHSYHSTLVNTFAVKDEYVAPTEEIPGFTQVTLFLPRSENTYIGTYHWDLYSKSPLDLVDFSQPPEVHPPQVWPPTDQIRTWLYGEVTILPRVTSTDVLPLEDDGVSGTIVAPVWYGPAAIPVFEGGSYVVGPNGRVP
jgi:hypothetical protein